MAICAIGSTGGIMPAPDIYMRKLCVGPTARGRVDILAPIEETLDTVARCYGRRMRDLTVIVLDRPRHEEPIEEIRAAGARIRREPSRERVELLISRTYQTMFTRSRRFRPPHRTAVGRL